jgi:hypothetical protein
MVLAITIIEQNSKLRISKGSIDNLAIIKGADVATVLYRVLSQCPDEFPPAASTELLFVTDADLRTSIRQDVSAIERAVASAEWKAATVLSGAAIEALLLWRLDQSHPTPADVSAAVSSARANGALKKDPPNARDEWSLSQFIEVAGELQIIKRKSVDAARLCNSYRNLIHPGRTQRLGEKCNRGTALLAVAALEHVITDLS